MNADDAPGPVSDGNAAPSIVFRDHDHVAFHHGRLFAIIWRLDTTPDAVKCVQRLVQDFVRTLSPPRFCLMNVVEETALPHRPTPDARAALQELLRGNGRTLVRSAVVYEGKGFGAAAGVRPRDEPCRAQPPPVPASRLCRAGQGHRLALGLSSELPEPASGFLLSEAVRSVRESRDAPAGPTQPR